MVPGGRAGKLGKVGKNADEAADAGQAARHADTPPVSRQLDELPATEVPSFNSYNDKYKALPEADKKAYLQEYNRQLKRQEDAINSMSADEFKAARDAYDSAGKRNPLAAKKQGDFRTDFKEEVSDSVYGSLAKKKQALCKSSPSTWPSSELTSPKSARRYGAMGWRSITLG